MTDRGSPELRLPGSKPGGSRLRGSNLRGCKAPDCSLQDAKSPGSRRAGLDAASSRRARAALALGLGLALGLALAACSAPASPKIILPGKLDLVVAAEDEARPSCPSEAPGTEKDNAIDCLYGAARDAFAPYAAQLKEKGWTPFDPQTWSGPADAEGVRPCLVVRSFQSNFRRRERTVLEFELVDPALGCPATGGAHA